MSLGVQASPISCGIDCIIGVEDVTLGHIKEFFDKLQVRKGEMCIFSGTKEGNVNLLVEYIKKHKLGTVTRARAAYWRNPNSGNKINMWMWQYNGATPSKS